MHWPNAIAAHAAAGRAYAIATVLSTSGSVPRGIGSKMVITLSGTDDSIGGGQLEYLVVEQAKRLLNQGGNHNVIQHFPLAAAANQCCGGSVSVLLECFAQPAHSVAVFGAGHVGRRVIHLLADLQLQLQWFDSRPDPIEESGVACLPLADPDAVVATLSKHTELLILTHDHQLDYRLVSQALSAGITRIGLIGSTTKWQRFSSRLTADGYAKADLARVRCPVGLTSMPNKQPMAVAVAIVAELLEQVELRQQPSAATQLSWRQIKESLVQVASPINSTHDC